MGARPTSSHGTDFPKLKTKPSRTFDLSDDADETNYEMLAKSSPHKAPPAKDNLDSFLSDDDEELVPVTKKIPVKAPAAKAYAAKQNKMKLTSKNDFSEDEDEDVDMED